MKSDLLSFRGKLIIGGAYGYVFNPFNIIPQPELPFYGYLDDALILVSLLYEVAEGNPEVVEKVGEEIAMVDSIREDIPEQILRLLSQYTAVIMGAAETLVNSSVKAGSGCD